MVVELSCRTQLLEALLMPRGASMMGSKINRLSASSHRAQHYRTRLAHRNQTVMPPRLIANTIQTPQRIVDREAITKLQLPKCQLQRMQNLLIHRLQTASIIISSKQISINRKTSKCSSNKAFRIRIITEVSNKLTKR